jgi:hypothetical protein
MMEKGAPTSNRICQDIRKFILALTGIRDARGICVQALESRAGHLAAAANGQVQRGGKREKKVATEDPWRGGDATAVAVDRSLSRAPRKEVKIELLFEIVPGCFRTRPFACALFAV